MGFNYRFLLRIASNALTSDLSRPVIMALPITAASSIGILFFVAFFSSPGALPRFLLSPFYGHAACLCRIPALHSPHCDLGSFGRICSSLNVSKVSAVIQNLYPFPVFLPP